MEELMKGERKRKICPITINNFEGEESGRDENLLLLIF
jgi:hypothetical protein